jgi:uncharacterized membrane-anchored protein YitT (DUF2179 family)
MWYFFMKISKIFSFLDILFIVLGCFLYSLGLNIFFVSNHIAAGGIIGLSTIIHFLFPILPIGALVIIFNIPLFIFSFKIFGKNFFIKTFVATMFFAIFVDIFSFFPVYSENSLLASIFGSLFCGFGLGIIYSRGMVTGGSDIIAKLIKYKLPHFPLGQLILLVDGLVVLLAGLVYKNITNMLYSIIAIFVSSKIIDTVLSGIDTAKTVITISEKSALIKETIISELKKTATIIDGFGAYSENKTCIIICVVRRHELFKLKNIIKKADENDFVIIVEATEVIGEGFNSLGTI